MGFRPDNDTHACPACGSADLMLLGAGVPGFEVSGPGYRFKHPDYGMLQCRRCSLCFKSRVPSPDELSCYYAMLECETFDHGKFPTDVITRRIINDLPPLSRVLDFGCSTGRILAPFTNKYVCYGVEVNSRAAAIAAGRGMKLIQPDSLTKSYKEFFDLVIITDVYEHLTEPVSLIRKLVRGLKPGGAIVIVTGNSDAVLEEEAVGENWYFRVYGHLIMANPKHFSWLSGVLDLELSQILRCSHYYTSIQERFIQWLRSTAYFAMKQNPQSFLSHVVRRVPRLKNAERWMVAPALTYREDHIVAVLRRQTRDPHASQLGSLATDRSRHSARSIAGQS